MIYVFICAHTFACVHPRMWPSLWPRTGPLSVGKAFVEMLTHQTAPAFLAHRFDLHVDCAIIVSVVSKNRQSAVTGSCLVIFFVRHLLRIAREFLKLGVREVFPRGCKAEGFN